MSLADGPKARAARRKWTMDRLAALASKLTPDPADGVDPMGRALDLVSDDDEGDDRHNEEGLR